MIISAAIVSDGAYMFEISEQGNSNGIFWILIIYFIIGLETIGLGYRISGLSQSWLRVRRFSWDFDRTVIFLSTGAALLFSAYVFLRYGGPVLRGVDRVTFWRELAPDYLSFIPTLVLQSFYFAGYYYFLQRSKGESLRIPLSILTFYIFAVFFVLGQKFSAFILLLNTWFFLIAAFLPNFKLDKKDILRLIFLITSLTASVILSYLLSGREAAFALARIALQAQVLWSVFNDSQALNFWPSSEWSCYFRCRNFVDGKDYISYIYLPFNLYDFYSKSGSQLSGFMPALSIHTMGLIASILIHVCINFTSGYLQGLIVKVIYYNHNMIFAFLLFKLHFGLSLVWYAAMQTAIPGVIFTLLLIAIYQALLFKRSIKKNLLESTIFIHKINDS